MKFNYYLICLLVLVLGIGLFTTVVTGTGTPKLVTDSPEPGQITTTTALLTGHLESPVPGQVYHVRFKYQGDDGTKHFTEESTLPNSGQYSYSQVIRNLQPGETIYYRAVAGALQSPSIPDADLVIFDVRSETPPESDNLDSFLDLINRRIDDPNTGYFNPKWDISKDQYKIMLATLAYAEGGSYGYSAHSSFLNETGPDMYQHVDAPDFYFSRGIGPFQIDTLVSNWPTIKKLNPIEATDLTLSEHKNLLGDNVEKIEDMRTKSEGIWMAYDDNKESNWPAHWLFITGTTWSNTKQCNITNPLPFTWDQYKTRYKSKLNAKWDLYGQVIKNIGKQHWLIKTEDEIETDSLKKITIDKSLETYHIKAIGIGKEWEYYYANDESNGIEFWAYYNPVEEQYNLKSIFWREYVGGAYPEKIIKSPGQVQKAGKTLGHKVIQDETASANVDVALIIDSSGSMVDNDPTNLRKAAAKLFIDLVDNEDKIAIVDFDDSVRTWQSLVNVGGNREILENAVNKVDSYGSTNIGGGLRYGYNEINGDAADPLHNKAVILLTDGQHNTGTDPLTVVPDYKTKGWPIYTIALSSAADKKLLKQISLDTNGQYYDVQQITALLDIYNRISLSIKGSSQLEVQKGQISQGQTIAKSMPIDSSVKAFNLVLTWPGSDLDLVLYYPDGSKVPINKSSPSGTDDPGISYINQSTYEIFKVLSPQTGTWRYDIIGVDVKNQEDYTLTLSAATTIRLNVVIDKQDYYPGEDVLITADFSDESGGISSAQVNAKVTLPNLSEEPLVLFENDTGKYGCTFSNTTQKGHYSVLVEAEKNGVVRQQQLEFDTGTGSIPPPIANFIVNNTDGVLPFNVQFNDTSTSSITSWEWDFDNNGIVDSTIQNPSFTYTTAGNYSVRLHVAGPGGSDETVKINYITVKPTFFADFTVSPVAGTAPLTVKCTDKSIGNPTWLVYDFGDGINVTGPNPVHIYQFPGVYTITLSIMKYNTSSYSVMGSVARKPNIITVSSVPIIPPIAKFTASPVTGTAPLTVSFTSQSTGSPTYMNYDFGDGINVTGANPVHTYRSPGIYNVTLSVFKFDSKSGSTLSNMSVQKNLIVVNGLTTGSIDIKSTPSGATVYLDNIPKGFTPIVLNSIPAGSHTLVLKNIGYPDYRTSMTVMAGKTITINPTLSAVPTALPTTVPTTTPILVTTIPTPAPIVTPTFVPTTVPTTIPILVTTIPTPTPITLPTPGPTEMLPVDYQLDFMVQSNGDASNPYMAVTLRGGNGINLDSRVDVTLTGPDGTSQQNYMLPQFYVGQQVTFPCSTNKNRVEIWVTAPTIGKVKVYDQIVTFKALNPGDTPTPVPTTIPTTTLIPVTTISTPVPTQTQITVTTAAPVHNASGLANPATVYCSQIGGTTVIKKDATGAEYGMCVFPNGSSCEEWALFRGECKPTTSSGSIDIQSTPPGAYVYLDGLYKGLTPIILNNIPVGSHSVILSMTGQTDYQTDTAVMVGQTTSVNHQFHGGVTQEASNIVIKGNVYGIASDANTKIGILQFDVGLAAGGIPIDVTKITINYSNQNITPTDLVFTNRTPGTTGGSWWILSSNSANNLLHEGEYFTIQVRPITNLTPREGFSLKLKPDIGAALGIDRTVPAGLSNINILY